MLLWDNMRHPKDSYASAPVAQLHPDSRLRRELYCDQGQHQWGQVGHVAALPETAQVIGFGHWPWLAAEAAASALPGLEAGQTQARSGSSN